MSLPDRNNPYSFEAFLNLLHDCDFYADDPFLQKTLKYLAGDEFVELDRKIREFSPKVSFRWPPLTDIGGKPIPEDHTPDVKAILKHCTRHGAVWHKFYQLLTKHRRHNAN